MSPDKTTQFRIKQKDIKLIRDKMLIEQGCICLLCGNKISPDEAVLDHDHNTGHIRAVLHRSCNSIEGRVMNLITRTKCTNTTTDKLNFLLKIINHSKVDYSNNPLHPTHKTDQELQRLKLKRKLKKLKRTSTIKETKELIARLDQEIKSQI